jgi:hypothetical protein
MAFDGPVFLIPVLEVGLAVILGGRGALGKENRVVHVLLQSH